MNSRDANPSTPILTRTAKKPGVASGIRDVRLLAVTGVTLLALAAVATPARVFSTMPAAPASLLPAQLQAPAGDQKPGASLSATDIAALREHLGQFVEVKGTPTGTGQSKSGGALYLNFSRQRGGAVTVVFFLPKGNATPPGSAGTRPASTDDLKQFIGKPVVVKGQLSDYQGDVQMVLPYLEQIKAQ